MTFLLLLCPTLILFVLSIYSFRPPLPHFLYFPPLTCQLPPQATSWGTANQLARSLFWNQLGQQLLLAPCLCQAKARITAMSLHKYIEVYIEMWTGLETFCSISHHLQLFPGMPLGCPICPYCLCVGESMCIFLCVCTWLLIRFSSPELFTT